LVFIFISQLLILHFQRSGVHALMAMRDAAAGQDDPADNAFGDAL
jgi:hypothetical protein